MYFKSILLSFFSLSSFCAISQTNFSVSANTGLVTAKENFGKSISVCSSIDFNRFSIGAGYLYSELENRDNINSDFRIYKYSVTGGYIVNSNDGKFQMLGKTGPSLLYFRGFNDDKPKVGLDIGLILSYNIFQSLDVEMGVINTFNKVTTNFLQTSFGLKYNFRKKVSQ